MAEKVKKVYWKKEIARWVGPLQARANKLFREYEKQAKDLNVRTPAEHNDLWNRKFKERFERIDKRTDEAYRRLWLKYYVSSGSTKVKPGYKIVGR